MPIQRSASLEPWPEEAKARNGVVVAGGYGARISVWRGRLRVDDGSGRARRSYLYHRATSGLKRLVVLGHTGYVSLEALRWMADIKSAYLQIDADGRVLATFGPPGTDRPTLRRAQAMASQVGRALELSKWIVEAKLHAQLATLQRFSNRLDTAKAHAIVASYRRLAADATSTDELRAAEAWAAAAYWQAFAPLQVRFARRDADRVPGHWRTFGGRSSPIANGPRMAGNPANAVLNYLYALLEAEATLSARIVGPDPGLGLMHADQAFRESLAADLMEPVRPLVDAFAFELLATRGLAATDFFERRDGVCRVTAPLTHELAQTCARWRLQVGKVAEDVARALEPRRTTERAAPTPISQRQRAEGRPQRANASATGDRSRFVRACSWCGGQVQGKRNTCSDECAAQVRAQVAARFAETSSARMKELHRTGHPARTVEGNRKRAETRQAQRHAELAWDRSQRGEIDDTSFERDIRPLLLPISARKLARKTGLSTSYCAAILRGTRVPHPRWWRMLRQIGHS
jgi:CRISPR-associated endonuclease Cas1